MAIRHVKDYVKEIEAQYQQMVDILHELERELENNVVAPEVVDNFKATMEPIKNNKDRLDYILFLFNKPNKEPKVKKYVSQNKKLLKQIEKGSKENILKENEKSLQELKHIVNSIAN